MIKHQTFRTATYMDLMPYASDHLDAEYAVVHSETHDLGMIMHTALQYRPISNRIQRNDTTHIPSFTPALFASNHEDYLLRRY